ncbi:ABC transporter substrate-binding protein [Mesorhizobium sp. DCY119]|uniref:ABC transporter substrate-binding protein n=1 Tax=Mesorhizobium sp. DCY119 TaxID=2108445 RepID=UPI000E767AAE|nr:ABC transporter substrate-binding protein [Mesorhizobium sp. DCY119]RJG40593.1 hypothetical protein D3Y55_25300 [Mesorhizobium sp. DCY119]
MALAMTIGVRAQDLDVLRVSTIPIIDLTPLHVGIAKGFFADEGLEIDSKVTPGSAAGIPGMIGGAFDIVYGAPASSIQAYAQGLDIRVIAPGVKIAPGVEPASIIARKGSGLSGPALKGKSIAVNTRNGNVYLYARAWVEARGGDPDTVTYREIPFPQMQDALAQGSVDAAFLVEPFKSVAAADPKFEIIGDPFGEVQPTADAGHYMTTSAFLADHRDLVERFNRALARSVAYYNDNRGGDEVRGVVASFTRLPTDILAGIQLYPMPTKVDPEQLRLTAELMQRHGMLDAVPDLTEFVDRLALGE